MKVLRGLFIFLYAGAFITNGLLFLYVEWSYLRTDFIQFFNPFLHLQVVLALCRMPLFWTLTVLTILGYFAMRGAQEHIDEGI